jgi:lysyl-tRNA synthetase class 2
MSRSITFRQLLSLGVATAGVEAALSAATPNLPGRQLIIGRIAPPAVPSFAHLLALIGGFALLALTPKLWRGTRTAASLAIAGLVTLAVLNLVKGLDYDESLLDLGLAALIVAGRRAFQLGCRKRPQLAVVCGALLAWALVYSAKLVGPLVSDRGHTINQALHHTLHVSLQPTPLSASWQSVIDLLIGAALVVSAFALRSWLRPAAPVNHHGVHEQLAARAIVERHGEDSLSPFILRPDKAFHFAADGVLAYRVLGDTAIVSGDPVAPRGRAPEVLASFREFARAHGWAVVVWGASARDLEGYRRLGLHALCGGEEAVVEPAGFTLDGRRVRKLRQSVHRLKRLGWSVEAYEGRAVDARVEQEVDAAEAAWRSRQRKVLGFAMSMGPWDPELRPNDLYLLARAPEGDLRAFMRFVAHRGRLSLESMRRLEETPNGVNEALICRALECARERGVPEVSLNYAGLAHLLRGEAERGPIARALARPLAAVLGRRFQLTRLVRFNDKFFPQWRPRFLIYESRLMLPGAVTRVLQVEGYVPQGGRRRVRRGDRTPSPALAGSPQTDAAR